MHKLIITIALLLTNVLTLLPLTELLAQQTYYSRNRGGNWSDLNSWTFRSNGNGPTAGSTPGYNDHVVILNGSIITIDQRDANGIDNVTPASLGYTNAPNESQFFFYQAGNVTIDEGGTLVSTYFRVLTDGKVTIKRGGNLRLDQHYMATSNVIALEGSQVNLKDDFIVAGKSETINNGKFSVGDDLYIYGTAATICGSQEITIGDMIKELEGANASQQICSDFMIYCTDGDCGMNTGGSFQGSGEGVLPIDLLSFAAESQNSKIQLDWVTAWEENFDFFTVERAGPDMQFTAISEVKGKGNSTAEVAYSFADHFPLQGQAFYRLKATDFDGFVEYHRIISVFHDSLVQPELNIYPNPVTNKEINVQRTGIRVAEIQILDLTGRVVLTRQVSEQILQLSLPSFIRPGTYLLVATGTEGERLQQKIMVL
jgi:hypothetical protein